MPLKSKQWGTSRKRLLMKAKAFMCLPYKDFSRQNFCKSQNEIFFFSLPFSSVLSNEVKCSQHCTSLTWRFFSIESFWNSFCCRCANKVFSSLHISFQRSASDQKWWNLTKQKLFVASNGQLKLAVNWNWESCNQCQCLDTHWINNLPWWRECCFQILIIMSLFHLKQFSRASIFNENKTLHSDDKKTTACLDDWNLRLLNQ